MIQTTMQAILDDTITSGQLQHHYLYLVADEEVVLYIGQAVNPVERLQHHIGLQWGARSEFGELFQANLPLSASWKLELYTLADCVELVKQYILPELAPVYTLELHFAPERLRRSINWTEQALIRRYHPCLNHRYNMEPMPLPERYRRKPGTSSLFLPSIE